MFSPCIHHGAVVGGVLCIFRFRRVVGGSPNTEARWGSNGLLTSVFGEWVGGSPKTEARTFVWGSVTSVFGDFRIARRIRMSGTCREVCYPPFSAMVLGLADGGGWARGETGAEGGEIIADGGRRIMKSLPPEYGRDEALVLRNRGEFEKPN